MLSWILLILIVALVAVLGLITSAAVFGRGEVVEPLPPTADVIARNRRAVEAGDIDAIELEVVPRGYRMDQVDALIEQLAEGRRSGEGVELTAPFEAESGEREYGSYETQDR
ncbi:hypothetical protein CAPI_06710 [Corynebacterium capitovis DSM 44611]|uniref:DivIVA domain-containing protein n=1 Tax=Corynebacterium capitovis TaxID=131081 RepID=UPI000372F365|nr:DivIVA domain-containing protein [Corynebacterium capitovis]WKD57882.1 hypothetical protein CAPI_06710 [Corynebacterium capitovis DSM 44611]